MRAPFSRLPNCLFTLLILQGKLVIVSLWPHWSSVYATQTQACRHSFRREQAALLNVLASVCDVLPADSFVHWRKQPGGCSHTMTVHRFFECLARMLGGFRTVARTLLLTVTSHWSRKVAAHKRTSCDSYMECNAIMYELNAIRLMTVNLCSYGSNLWGNKNDTRRGQNRQCLVRTAE